MAVSDLDRFKGVDDRYGHAEGDRLLFCLASHLREAARGGDLVARFGGDEFILIVRSAADNGVAAVQRIMDSVGPGGTAGHLLCRGRGARPHGKVCRRSRRLGEGQGLALLGGLVGQVGVQLPLDTDP